MARDPRIDLLRGFALVTLFIDHVADNPLDALTMRNSALPMRPSCS